MRLQGMVRDGRPARQRDPWPKVNKLEQNNLVRLRQGQYTTRETVGRGTNLVHPCPRRQPPDHLAEEKGKLRERTLDGLCGDQESHKVPRRNLLDGQQVASGIQRPQDHAIEEQIRTTLKEYSP